MFFEVLEGILAGRTTSVRGMMIESFLLPSAQEELLRHATAEDEREYILHGASRVDSCFNWETTERILREAFVRLNQIRQSELQETLT